jgi:hypothetical protein
MGAMFYVIEIVSLKTEVALMICLQEITGSNLGLSTIYHCYCFSWFSSVRRTNAEILYQIRHQLLPSKSFSNPLFTTQPTIRRYVLLATDSVVINISSHPNSSAPPNKTTRISSEIWQTSRWCLRRVLSSVMWVCLPTIRRNILFPSSE